MRFVVALLILFHPVAATAQPRRYETERHAFIADIVMTGMQQPVAMAFLPDGRALIAERRSARIHLFDPRSDSAVPVTGGPDVLTGVDEGVSDARRPAALTGEDAGVHDLVLHPQFETNRWVYISYSAGPRERSTTAIDRFRVDGTRLVERERIFTADAWSEDRFHYGGRMAFANGYLFVTIGDRHHQDRAQELTNHAGKLLRLHDDGRVPDDNPFVGKQVGRQIAKPEIWCYGLRNAQGLVVHPDSGEMWFNEHGPHGGDELNRVRRGANYGWPVISWGWQYTGGPIGQGITEKEGMEQPVWIWTRAIAPSGLIVYTGDRFPGWRGNFFSGAMAARHLNRLVLVNGEVIAEERVLKGEGGSGRIRLVAQSPDGFIYVGTDGSGQLIRLRPAP